MRTTSIALSLSLALPLGLLAGCRGNAPVPPQRSSPAMTEASFHLGSLRDASSSEVVIGFPEGSGIGAPWQLRHLDGDTFVNLPGARAAMLGGIRVLALDRIVLDLGADVAVYDGTTTVTLPMASAPAYEDRGVFATDTRSSTGEIFVVMSGHFTEDAIFCHGIDSLACAPLVGVAPPDRVQLVATDGHVYVFVERYSDTPTLYDVDASGVATEMMSPLDGSIARAGRDHVMVRDGVSTFVLSDDGAMEHLGAGHFEALGPNGDLLHVEVSGDFVEEECPSGVSCPRAAGPLGYTQYVVFRREGGDWVEHAHVDFIDEAPGDALLTLLPDRRVALTTTSVVHTFLTPALP